ncbi:hypothetical protein AVEN_109601-1 [Araneus ventricosus]|uniref:Uncharacterized protein n=1 Tax=Araneus ventricosus TaxID=182803 RepID=A0A4Y2MN57_ARAVE|nr:hypothetical protein AVEN_109601-1 [Araneus ventricosus]
MGWGKRRVFLEFGQCQLSLGFLRRGGEITISLKEELGRSRILRFLYYNGLRNQRVISVQYRLYLVPGLSSRLELSHYEEETASKDGRE